MRLSHKSVKPDVVMVCDVTQSGRKTCSVKTPGYAPFVDTEPTRNTAPAPTHRMTEHRPVAPRSPPAYAVPVCEGPHHCGRAADPPLVRGRAPQGLRDRRRRPQRQSEAYVARTMSCFRWRLSLVSYVFSRLPSASAASGSPYWHCVRRNTLCRRGRCTNTLFSEPVPPSSFGRRCRHVHHHLTTSAGFAYSASLILLSRRERRPSQPGCDSRHDRTAQLQRRGYCEGSYRRPLLPWFLLTFQKALPRVHPASSIKIPIFLSFFPPHLLSSGYLSRCVADDRRAQVRQHCCHVLPPARHRVPSRLCGAGQDAEERRTMYVLSLSLWGCLSVCARGRLMRTIAHPL